MLGENVVLESRIDETGVHMKKDSGAVLSTEMSSLLGKESNDSCKCSISVEEVVVGQKS